MDIFGVDQQIDKTLYVLLIFAFGWLIWIPVGAYVARQKRRKMIEGIILGCLGPIGCLLEALLPTLSEPSSTRKAVD